jgi:dimethylglycine dehydrogenase
MEIIDAAEIKRLFPYIETDGVVCGAHTTMDGHVDPAGCCNALATGARTMGASIQRHTRVTDINLLPSGAWEVITDKGNLIAEHVVNAAGCYARPIAQMAGTDVPIINMLHQYFVTDEIPEFAADDEEMPVVRDSHSSCYYRQEQKSALIGPYETATESAVEAWASAGGIPEWESESELFEADFERSMPHLEDALGRMPIWAEAGIKRGVHGAIPHTPDSTPLVGPAAGLRNFWHCCGSSIGIAQGAGCGKYLAQWMVHGAADINMASVDPRRFGAWAGEDYARAKSFEEYNRMYAVPTPGEEFSTGRPVRTSGVHDTLTGKGAVHTTAFGWERPKWFSPDGREEDYGFRRNNTFEVVAAECHAVHERVGIMDMSSFAKIDVTGTDAEALLNRIPRRNGGIALAHGLSRGGRIETECTVTCLADNHFFVVTGAAWEDRDIDRLANAARLDEDVTITNVTDDWGALVLAGPRARDVFAALTEADLSNNDFPWLTGREITVAGAPARALRVNYVGKLGWEIYVPMARLSALYEAICAAGESHGIANFGAYALNSLRMEKAYRAIALEMTNEVTCFEAGLDRFVDIEKGDFSGREATLAKRGNGTAFAIIYGEVDADDADILGGEPIYADDQLAGVTTSGGFGHRIGKSLFFGYVEPAALDATLEIQILGVRHRASALSEPAYDPENTRVKA